MGEHGGTSLERLAAKQLATLRARVADPDESKVCGSSKNRFELADAGFKRMNAGRPPGDLIREAVSNCFDADKITTVRVNIEPGHASIEDDSPDGIGDPQLIFTVFMTNKEDDPKKRGRKGRGLAELISAAEYAEVDTVGHRVEFAEGRTIFKSNRTVGTKVTVKAASWTQEDVTQAVLYMNRIIPPEGIKFYVNGALVKGRKTRSTYIFYLQTQIIKEGIQKDTYEYADVDIANLCKGETVGWIYEMGIPIQEVKCKFHINVQQRVPLNDHRDTVESYYLGQLYRSILTEMIDSLSIGALKQEWAQIAMGHGLSPAIKEKIVKKLYGEVKHLAVKSNNARANDIAKQHGIKVIDVASMPHAMEEIVVSTISTTEAWARAIDKANVDVPVDSSTVDPNGKLAAVVTYIGKRLINEDVKTEFYSRKADYTGVTKLAQYVKDTKVMSFNVASKEVPIGKPLSAEMLSLIVHELSHNKVSGHDDPFLEEVQKLSGKLAALMFTNRDEIATLIGTGIAQSPRKSTRRLIIHCVDCGAAREIYPQDAHQVTRCAEHANAQRKQRAKERNNVKQ